MISYQNLTKIIFEKNLLCVNEFLSPYVIFSLLILEKNIKKFGND